ncbi:class I SAM-dependent methyltransferase [Paenibacillus radicis (ex Xue et al. 2023)]|uniref:Class I SAM-dependent methyltransferase n=1 Tax=Paenibacillus radicis (ex Xue et al. 2023) TaxID=2972489 RepID=A0ABT1YAL8_9BACL|nr:class I SAM-dependent methyltransferase [Paenibacillus radicis (ex Xue et al. 2023)]MCR8630232.1 class I SAM-dependent methyltransferase [Paenibacillus radicis (ex Xue et al. 2023)]
MNEDLTFNSKLAELYDKNTRISIPTYDSLFAMIQSYYRVQLGEKAASLLVIGAGGGNELSAWGPSNPRWTFTGVDPSEEMLKIAKHKATELGLKSRVNLIQGTTDDIPQPDSKFDAASCILVLHFIDNVQEKLKLLVSIKDKLKSGAPFALVSAYGNHDASELQARLNVWKSFWIDAGRETSKIDQMVNDAITKLSLLPEKQIEELLAESGFTQITRFYSTGIMAGWICHAE